MDKSEKDLDTSSESMEIINGSLKMDEFHIQGQVKSERFSHLGSAVITIGAAFGIMAIGIIAYKSILLRKETSKKLSVIGLIIKNRTKNFNLIIITLIFSSFLFLFIDSTSFAYLSITTAALLLIQQLAFAYRISHGLYGSANSEAREVIQFILDRAEDIDFTDGGKPKKILKPEDLEYFKQKTQPSVAPEAVPGATA